jgi:hypothetical protein
MECRKISKNSFPWKLIRYFRKPHKNYAGTNVLKKDLSRKVEIVTLESLSMTRSTSSEAREMEISSLTTFILARFSKRQTPRLVSSSLWQAGPKLSHRLRKVRLDLSINLGPAQAILAPCTRTVT